MERRRYLLVTAAMIGFAGCNDSAGDTTDTDVIKTDAATSSATITETPSSTPTQTDTPTDTPTTPTDSPDPTERPTETSTETATETESETPTETPTDTHTPEPTPDLVDKEVNTALDYIGDSITRYAANVPLDGVPITNEVAVDDIRDGLFEARNALHDAEDYSPSTEQQQRIERARKAQWFAWWIGQTHNAIHAAYQARPSAAGAGIDTFQAKIDSADSEISQIRKDAAARGLDVISGYSPDAYDQCLSRFEDILTNCEDLIDVAEAVQQAEDRHERAMTQYNAENYGLAERYLEEARNAYDDAVESITEYDPVEAFVSLRDSMECYCSSMSKRCVEYIEAARYGQEDERTRRITTEETATDPQDECDLAAQ